MNFKILVTGAKGFVGRNLCLKYKNLGYDVIEFDVTNTNKELEEAILQSRFIIHLAGINRPKDVSEFHGNVSLTEEIVNILKKNNVKVPILMNSSIQADLDNDYGKSKKEAEDLLLKFQQEYKNPVYILRCPNVFGKWCRPNYNSVVATFCYNVCNNIPLQVNKDAKPVPFIYIDDLIDIILSYLHKTELSDGVIKDLNPVYKYTPSEIADLLQSFKESRFTYDIPLQDGFVKKLYATYLSYLKTDDFCYDLNPHCDDRGSFTELYRTTQYGQTSVNVIHPDIEKGNHYHDTKNEKFIVVSGRCEIKFRKIGDKEIYSYIVSGFQQQVVDIPPGYTHSIKNIGSEDAVVVMWASEPFNSDNPDTYFESVEL